MSVHHVPAFSRRQLLSLSLTALLVPRQSAVAQNASIYTFVVLGLDTRNDGDSSIRSDTIMVSRVDLTAGTVRTLSIPRDLYADIPGHGWAKINDAYTIGLASAPDLDWHAGAASAVSTIEHNFGLSCDGVAVSDLLRFPAIIDAVGGIEVDNPYAVYVEGFDDISDGTKRTLDFPAGRIFLDGADAMDFVRTRQQDGDGGRIMRQHLVLTTLLDKLQTPETLASIPELITALNDAVRTDIPLALQAQLIAAIPGISVDNLAFTNIDHLLTSGYTAGGAWIYEADWTTLPAYVQGWLDGTIT